MRILLPEDPYPWTVKKILRPTKFDTYLLIQRVDKDHFHNDPNDDEEKTVDPILMLLLDTGNDEFFTYNKKNLKLIKRQIKHKQKEESTNDLLTSDWLNNCRKLKVIS